MRSDDPEPGLAYLVDINLVSFGRARLLYSFEFPSALKYAPTTLTPAT